MSLRTLLLMILSIGLTTALTGCGSRLPADQVDLIIGEQGLMPGQFNKPRAIAIDQEGNLAVVDFRAMIQWLAPDGKPIIQWQTPTHQFGRPSGLGIDRSGNLLVADSHYHRVLVYDRQGNILRTYGGDEGTDPLVGRFGYIADAECDSKGNIFIAESQNAERITKISPDGKSLLSGDRSEASRANSSAFVRCYSTQATVSMLPTPATTASKSSMLTANSSRSSASLDRPRER